MALSRRSLGLARCDEKSDLINKGKFVRTNARACRRCPWASARDITCDGSVMAETAEICRCDGVMDRITCFRRLATGLCRFEVAGAYAVWYPRRHS
jgi:hypothetical protein